MPDYGRPTHHTIRLISGKWLAGPEMSPVEDHVVGHTIHLIFVARFTIVSLSHVISGWFAR